MAVQTALVAHSMSWADHVCAAAQLSTPAARSHTRALFALLAPLTHLTPLSVLSAGATTAPPYATQCTTLLRFFQLLSGLGALVLQAAMQAELHAAHQRQRRSACLSPERGVSARLYAAVHALANPALQPQLWLAAALIVGLCWQLALGLSLPA